MKNVVFTYSLEHTSIDDLFSSIFNCLDRLQKEKEEVSLQFNELTCSIGTIQTTISQHMLKEEEQVFTKSSLSTFDLNCNQFLARRPLLVLRTTIAYLDRMSCGFSISSMEMVRCAS